MFNVFFLATQQISIPQNFSIPQEIPMYLKLNLYQYLLLMMILWEICNHIHNTLRLFDVFLSLKVKRNAIISNKHGIYELLPDLPNELNLGFWKISKYQKNVKTSLNYSLVPSLTPKIKVPLKNRTLTFPVVHYFTWKLDFVSNILSMISDPNKANNHDHIAIRMIRTGA